MSAHFHQILARPYIFQVLVATSVLKYYQVIRALVFATPPISATIRDASSSLMTVNFCVVPYDPNFLAFLSDAVAIYQPQIAYIFHANNHLELY